MAAKVISIEMKGIRHVREKTGLKSFSGVYCVFPAIYNKVTNKFLRRELIYIGESEDVSTRITTAHEHIDNWKAEINKGDVLCYIYGKVSDEDRERAEAALIFEHQPPVNVQLKDKFTHDETTISLSGLTNLLTPNFTVDKTG